VPPDYTIKIGVGLLPGGYRPTTGPFPNRGLPPWALTIGLKDLKELDQGDSKSHWGKS